MIWALSCSGRAFCDEPVADPTPDLPWPWSCPRAGSRSPLLHIPLHTALQCCVPTPSRWWWAHKCPERVTKRSDTGGWSQNCYRIIRKSEMDRKTVQFVFNSSSIHYTTSCKMGAAQFPVSQPPPGNPCLICSAHLDCSIPSHEGWTLPLISSALLPVRGSLLRQLFHCCGQPSLSFTCEGFQGWTSLLATASSLAKRVDIISLRSLHFVVHVTQVEATNTIFWHFGKTLSYHLKCRCLYRFLPPADTEILTCSLHPLRTRYPVPLYTHPL